MENIPKNNQTHPFNVGETIGETICEQSVDNLRTIGGQSANNLRTIGKQSANNLRKSVKGWISY
jgi:hypothetical protein